MFLIFRSPPIRNYVVSHLPPSPPPPQSSHKHGWKVENEHRMLLYYINVVLSFIFFLYLVTLYIISTLWMQIANVNMNILTRFEVTMMYLEVHLVFDVLVGKYLVSTNAPYIDILGPPILTTPNKFPGSIYMFPRGKIQTRE